jgi:hypothetical protein
MRKFLFVELMYTSLVHEGDTASIYPPPHVFQLSLTHFNFRPGSAYRDQVERSAEPFRLSRCSIAHITSSRSTNKREPGPENRHGWRKVGGLRNLRRYDVRRLVLFVVVEESLARADRSPAVGNLTFHSNFPDPG